MHTPPLILIVDDENAFPEIMSVKLTSLGYAVVVVHNDTDAIRTATEQLPDLILMDIYMPPGPTGTDVALTIKQQPGTKDIRIAFLSSLKEPWSGVFDTEHKQALAHALGMEMFLDKTEDVDVLATKVVELLKATPHTS